MNAIVYPAIQERTRVLKDKRKSDFARTHKIVDHQHFKIDQLVLYRDHNVSHLDPKWKSRRAQARIAGYGKYGAYTLKNLDGSLINRDVPAQHIYPLKEKANSQAYHCQVTMIANHRIVHPATEATATGKDYEYLVNWANGYETWEPIASFDDFTCIQTYWKRRRDAKPPKDMLPPNASVVPPRIVMQSNYAPALKSSIDNPESIDTHVPIETQPILDKQSSIDDQPSIEHLVSIDTNPVSIDTTPVSIDTNPVSIDTTLAQTSIKTIRLKLRGEDVGILERSSS
jgi:hypothetical protein